MGTRADFYVGRGKDAEWLGSIAWDGDPEGLRCSPMLGATTEEHFRAAVAGFLSVRDDGTPPELGWPWPWEDSRTTDYAYAFDGDKVWVSCFGHEWYDPLLAAPDREHREQVAVFPDMTARQTVTYGPRSGLIVLGSRGGQ